MGSVFDWADRHAIALSVACYTYLVISQAALTYLLVQSTDSLRPLLVAMPAAWAADAAIAWAMLNWVRDCLGRDLR